MYESEEKKEDNHFCLLDDLEDETKDETLDLNLTELKLESIPRLIFTTLLTIIQRTKKKRLSSHRQSYSI